MIEIRHPREGDAERLGARLRPGDEAEVQAAGFEPVEAVEISLGQSHEAWVAEEDGQVIAAWGYTAMGMFAEAEVWLLTAPEVERHRKLFLRMNTDFLAYVLEHHGSAMCHVHAEYRKAVNWLAWLGFQPAGKVFINGAEFLEMRLRRH